MTTQDHFRIGKKSIKAGGFPFEINDKPNKRLREAIKDDGYKTFNDVEDGWKWLNN